MPSSKALQNILFVEDEPDIQRVVKLVLETTAGMRVFAYSSGEEAIAHSDDAIFDLILLDVMMPTMDGPTTLARLRDIPALAQTPAIFMTAKAHPNEIAYFKALGAVDVIPKPFDPLTLAATLRAAWSSATMHPLDSARESNQAPAAAPVLTAEQRFAERMAALAAQFRDELPARLATLQEQWHTWCESPCSDTLNALHNTTHNLAGLGSTFGYDDLTQRARALDRHFKGLLAQKQSPDTALQIEMRALFADLDAELRRILLQCDN